MQADSLLSEPPSNFLREKKGTENYRDRLNKPHVSTSIIIHRPQFVIIVFFFFFLSERLLKPYLSGKIEGLRYEHCDLFLCHVHIKRFSSWDR